MISGESEVIDAQPFTNVDRRNDTVTGDASLQSEYVSVLDKQTNVTHETPAQTQSNVGWRPSGS